MEYVFLVILGLFIGVVFKIVSKLDKKDPDLKTNWKSLGFLSLFFIFVLYFVYYVFATMILKEIEYKPIITISSVVVAVVSVITTIIISNRNTTNTVDNQKTVFIMNLIKNNFDLLKAAEDSIDDLVNKLNSIYIGKTFFFDELAVSFHNHLRSSSLLMSQVDRFDVSTLSNKQQKEVVEDLKKIFTNNKIDASSKILISYLSLPANSRVGNHFYENLNESITNKVITNGYDILDSHFDMNKIIDDFCELVETREIFDKSISGLNFDEIKPGMEKAFDDNYKELGHFFRNSYRIVKFINQNSKNDLNFKKTYLGLLRSYYSENVLLAIYYNSVFTRKGLGYARELVLSDFFGDKDDLDDGNPNHIRKDKLYFGDKDLRTIEKLFTSSSTKLDNVDLTNINVFEDVIRSSFNQRN